jgi:hypothetical protein
MSVGTLEFVPAIPPAITELEPFTEYGRLGELAAAATCDLVDLHGLIMEGTVPDPAAAAEEIAMTYFNQPSISPELVKLMRDSVVILDFWENFSGTFSESRHQKV